MVLLLGGLGVDWVLSLVVNLLVVDAFLLEIAGGDAVLDVVGGHRGLHLLDVGGVVALVVGVVAGMGATEVGVLALLGPVLLLTLVVGVVALLSPVLLLALEVVVAGGLRGLNIVLSGDIVVVVLLILVAVRGNGVVSVVILSGGSLWVSRGLSRGPLLGIFLSGLRVGGGLNRGLNALIVVLALVASVAVLTIDGEVVNIGSLLRSMSIILSGGCPRRSQGRWRWWRSQRGR
ncbi:hypothetical protein FGO68_gene1941 [Halteria grandinella]|uniref:Uncharacterized protein n=1 Tax=Halteria grandinella TaxID=5974 RepID=A0A8J8T1T2_HALGN|nr:hypothetical protein FGO68_gene1941 [Halteria grandinella]